MSAQPDETTMSEITDAAIGAKWRANSSLEEWFPYSAKELIALRDEVVRLRSVIRRAANILAGGEGVTDQGDAYDKAQRLLDDATTPT